MANLKLVDSNEIAQLNSAWEQKREELKITRNELQQRILACAQTTALSMNRTVRRVMSGQICGIPTPKLVGVNFTSLEYFHLYTIQ